MTGKKSPVATSIAAVPARAVATAAAAAAGEDEQWKDF
jgi:hypothetical protein